MCFCNVLLRKKEDGLLDPTISPNFNIATGRKQINMAQAVAWYLFSLPAFVLLNSQNHVVFNLKSCSMSAIGFVDSI